MGKLIALLKERPYLVLWFFGALLAIGCCVSYLFKIDTNFLLNVGDTYFVVAHSHIFLLSSLWFLLCGFGYFFLKKFNIIPVYLITKIHLFITLLSLFGVIIDQFTNNDGVETLIVWASIMIFFIGQIIYFVNIIVATLLKLNQKNKTE